MTGTGPSGPDIAAVAGLLGDRTRLAMLTALTDDRALPASELALLAGISRSTASEHLSRLVEQGLLVTERCGRHTYYRMASADVAGALEALAVIAPHRRPHSLRTSRELAALGGARMCYDHLAGELGVRLADSLWRQGLLRRTDDGFAVDAAEWDARAPLGVRCSRLAGARRPLARACLDWSERRHHLAGGLGAALAARLFDLGWVTRSPVRHRAVRISAEGSRGLDTAFGFRPAEDLAEPAGG
ncbi:ArsR/SmtB family transcription factor [Actinokineospora inagensis]|uniref:ArsR/SmtB family transcription factor n=1 Tax=Actinokineospora inagensis TaxID=103730 RepID=UPI0003FF2D56|nr:winged helix-turn-helix domain-containing protein [Actinokineospora inagensis]